MTDWLKNRPVEDRKKLLRLETFFLVALFMLLVVLLAIAVEYHQGLNALRNAGLVLWMSFTAGGVFHHLRHLRTDKSLEEE